MRIGSRMVMVATLMSSVFVLGSSPAFGAPIGPVRSAQLSAFKMAASTGAPTVVAWDNFIGANGANEAGRVTRGGSKTWAVNPTGGSWQIQTNASQSTTPDSSLVIDGGSANGSAVVTVVRNGTTFDAGLTINRDSAGSQFLTAEWTSNSNGSMELWAYDGGSWTVLNYVTNLYPGGLGTAPASIILTLTSSSANVVTAYINGVSVVTATLAPADIATYKNTAHQKVGLYQWLSTATRWDDFHLDNP